MRRPPLAGHALLAPSPATPIHTQHLLFYFSSGAWHLDEMGYLRRSFTGGLVPGGFATVRLSFTFSAPPTFVPRVRFPP
jgi:hypothetical protein